MTEVGFSRHSEGVKWPKNPIEPPHVVAVLMGSFAALRMTWEEETKGKLVILRERYATEESHRATTGITFRLHYSQACGLLGSGLLSYTA